jgi:hypothetical protein
MAFRASLNRVVLLLIACLGLAGGASAQIGNEDRHQIRQEMREHWRQLPPEERQRIRQERQDRHESFQQMPPEDRSRLRDELRGQRNGGGGQNFEHRGGGRR